MALNRVKAQNCDHKMAAKIPKVLAGVPNKKVLSIQGLRIIRDL